MAKRKYDDIVYYKPNNCYKCGEDTVVVSQYKKDENSPHNYFVRCYSCGEKGPSKESPDSALKSWNSLNLK